MVWPLEMGRRRVTYTLTRYRRAWLLGVGAEPLAEGRAGARRRGAWWPDRTPPCTRAPAPHAVRRPDFAAAATPDVHRAASRTERTTSHPRPVASLRPLDPSRTFQSLEIRQGAARRRRPPAFTRTARPPRPEPQASSTIQRGRLHAHAPSEPAGTPPRRRRRPPPSEHATSARAPGPGPPSRRLGSGPA